MKLNSHAGILLFMLLDINSVASAGNKLKSLCEIRYPSDSRIESTCLQLKWTDTPGALFGEHWQDVLKFNRMDRRHFTGGVSIKVPKRLEEIRNFSPLPQNYPAAITDAQFILIDQFEMFLGAYEYGKLVMSFPVAIGSKGHRAPTGIFRIDAADASHTSKSYLMEEIGRPYPMHYGLRYFVDKKSPLWDSYWIHGRDVPGYPASHGCIGLYDEQMQYDYYDAYDRKVNKSNYHQLEKPFLDAARRLSLWAVPTGPDTGTFHRIYNGPRVQIIGEPPL